MSDSYQIEEIDERVSRLEKIIVNLCSHIVDNTTNHSVETAIKAINLVTKLSNPNALIEDDFGILFNDSEVPTPYFLPNKQTLSREECSKLHSFLIFLSKTSDNPERMFESAANYFNLPKCISTFRKFSNMTYDEFEEILLNGAKS
jgi:hypothetical protein